MFLEGLESRTLLATWGLDSSWGQGGLITSSSTESYTPLYLQPDGKLLVRKFDQTSAQSVVRFDSDGQIDPTWNGNITRGVHYQTQRLPSGEFVRSPYFYYYNSSNNPLRIVKFDVRGNYEKRFGTDGEADIRFKTSPVPGLKISRVRVDGIKQDSKGNLYVLVFVLTDRHQNPDNLGGAHELIKLDPRGRVDHNFGDDGIIILQNDQAFYSQLAIDKNDRIYFGKTVGSQNMEIRRYNSEGTLDTHYGTNGVATVLTTLDRGDQSILQLRVNYSSNAIAVPWGLFPDGSIFYGDLFRHQYAYRKLDSNGLPDTEFGNDGVVPGNTSIGRVDLNGNLLLVGDHGIMRYDQNGIRDMSISDLETIGFYGMGSAIVSPQVVYATTQFTGLFAKLTIRNPIELSSDGKLRLTGTPNDDRVEVRAIDRGIRVQVGDSLRILPLDTPIHGIIAYLGEGNDHYFSNLRVPMNINAGGGNDTITTGNRRDTVIGGTGEDFIRTGDGADHIEDTGDGTIDSGPNFDLIQFAGNQYINMGDGGGYLSGNSTDRSTIRAGDGQYELYVSGASNPGESWPPSAEFIFRLNHGTYNLSTNYSNADIKIDSDLPSQIRVSGDSRVVAGSGDDEIDAGDNCTIDAGDGNDTIYVSNHDTAYGGIGNDHFFIKPHNNKDRLNYLYGGQGDDDFQTQESGIGIDFIFGGKGTDSATADTFDSLDSVEIIN